MDIILGNQREINGAIAAGKRFSLATSVNTIRIELVGSYKMDILATVLKGNNSLTDVTFKMNGRMDAVKLIECFHTSKILKRVAIEGNHEGLESAIGALLQENSSIKALELDFVDPANKALLKGLTANTSLTSLKVLSFNPNDHYVLENALQENGQVFAVACLPRKSPPFQQPKNQLHYTISIERRLSNESKLSQLIKRNDWEKLAQFLKDNRELLTKQMYPDNVNLSTKTFADKLAIHTIQPLFHHARKERSRLAASVEETKNTIQLLTNQREELLRQAAALEAQVVNASSKLKVDSEELVKRKQTRDRLDQNLTFFRSALASHEPALKKWQQRMQSDVSDWSHDDVSVFLTEIGLKRYSAIFATNKIDGAVLQQLETRDLMTTLNVSFKDAKKIMMYVYLAQTHHDIYTIPAGVLQWNNDTVCTWLEDNKFAHLVGVFRDNEVVGAELAFLEKSDLTDQFKIQALGDVIKLQKEILKLKNSLNEKFLQTQMRQTNNNNADYEKMQCQLKELQRINDDLKATLKEKNTKIPDAFICPITQDIMQDPVVASDGHTYERTAIELWLKNNNTSPMIGLQLANKQLTPSHTLKSMIKEFVDAAKK